MSSELAACLQAVEEVFQVALDGPQERLGIRD